jgi:myo-inositol-1(or 4)-monophosphatase
MLDEIKKVALATVKQAGEILVKEYYKFNRQEIKLKSHHEILTKADLFSEEVIIRQIKKNFPSHCLISEEKGEVNGCSDFCWYIDPLDGTTNFFMHDPLWAVSLALAYQQEIILGIIYAPLLNELFVAEKAAGARLNGKRIFVSVISRGKVLNTFCHGKKLADIKKALIYYRKQKLIDLDCRQLGSAALELAYVAIGRVESFVAPGASDWDVAAGVILVREAGGKVTDFTGRPWRLGSGNIAASNGKVHQQILRVINSK